MKRRHSITALACLAAIVWLYSDVLSSLAERNILRSDGGQAAFSVLLFQDISVIPILAVFPLLGAAPAAAATAETQAAWVSVLYLLGAVVGVILAGRFIVQPLFQFLARVNLRESFIAAALMLVVGTALLMQQVGLSWLASLVIAALVNLAITGLAAWRTARFFDHMGLHATRRQLSRMGLFDEGDAPGTDVVRAASADTAPAASAATQAGTTAPERNA